jgi:hypothetical protein
MAEQRPGPGTPIPGQGPPGPVPPWQHPISPWPGLGYPARPGTDQVIPGTPYPGPRPRGRDRAWTWPLLCLIQACVYGIQIVVFLVVMWGVYGDGNPTAAENQSAGQWTIVFGVIAAAVAAWPGIVAWRAGPRAVAIGEFVLIAVILAVTGYGAADLMLMK